MVVVKAEKDEQVGAWGGILRAWILLREPMDILSILCWVQEETADMKEKWGCWGLEKAIGVRGDQNKRKRRDWCCGDKVKEFSIYRTRGPSFCSLHVV